MSNFYLFGDSICFSQYVSIEKTWVCNSAKHLNIEYDDRYVFMNASIPGNTTRDGLVRLQYDVLTRNPNIVYIQFGLNDCNIWETGKGIPRVPINSFMANLYEIIVNLKAYSVNPIILGTNHPTNKDNSYNYRNMMYNEVIRDVVDKTGSYLIDHEVYWKGKNCVDFLLSDGVHLNENGNWLYYEAFVDKIKSIL